MSMQKRVDNWFSWSYSSDFFSNFYRLKGFVLMFGIRSIKNERLKKRKNFEEKTYLPIEEKRVKICQKTRIRIFTNSGEFALIWKTI